MLSLLSTLGGLLISGLPKLLEYFQDRQDKKHELELARMQGELQTQAMREGFLAQQRVEEIRTDQVAMQTNAQMVEAALKHDEKVLDKADKWLANYVGTVRPTVTYLFVLEIIAINAFLAFYLWKHPQLITDFDSLMRYLDMIFTADEMAMLGGIVGFWFGSRAWGKK